MSYTTYLDISCFFLRIHEDATSQVKSTVWQKEGYFYCGRLIINFASCVCFCQISINTTFLQLEYWKVHDVGWLPAKLTHRGPWTAYMNCLHEMFLWDMTSKLNNILFCTSQTQLTTSTHRDHIEVRERVRWTNRYHKGA